MIDEDGTIIAGHGRLIAANKMGIKKVPVMVVRGSSPDAALLQRVGEALFEANATAGLCEALNVSPRAMRRWLNGTNEIPPRLVAELRGIVADKIATLSGLARELDQID